MRKKKMKQQKQSTQLNAQGELMESISTDPFGMYTGIPDDPNERPIQDADDL